MCEREWKLGDVLLNEVIVSSNERTIKIYRDDKEIFSNDTYIPDEILMVTMSDTSGDRLFQTNGGHFDPGGCDGLRSSRKSTALIMPHLPQVVSIYAGVSIFYSSKIFIVYIDYFLV